MPAKKISYSRGFPYGAPLAMVRGGATRDADVKAFLKSQGFFWDGMRYAWTHYLGREEFGGILLRLREEFGCEISPKGDLDANYRIDLDHPRFRSPA